MYVSFMIAVYSRYCDGAGRLYIIYPDYQYNQYNFDLNCILLTI
jgi:hypothetical protein